MQHPDDRISPAQDAVLRVQGRIIRAIPDSKDKTVTAKLLVASNQIGCLLGKGGSIISEMRKSTGAHIRIMGKDQIPKCASEGEEVVQVCFGFFYLDTGWKYYGLYFFFFIEVNNNRLLSSTSML